MHFLTLRLNGTNAAFGRKKSPNDLKLCHWTIIKVPVISQNSRFFPTS